MLNILTPIPDSCFIACSGGIDSMVLLDFVWNARKNPVAVYFNHGTRHGQEAEIFLKEECKHKNIELLIGKISKDKPPELSPEEHWRNERYKMFNSLPGKILTAHHLGDAVEWWVFSSFHGQGKLIPTKNGNVLRPLLATSKKEIKKWAERKEVKYINDPSNDSRAYMRNLIRHDIIPNALKVNPGLETVIRKKYQKQ